MNFTQPIPLTLYVHYPWCVQKCPYCDFNSHRLKDDIDEARYIDALIRQLEQTLPMIWGRPIHAIFFGGGTPSLFSESGFNRFMSQARALLGFGPEIEITLEANPGTVDIETFAGLYQAGVNRLSMGIQSFEDEKLKALGRIHSGTEACRAIEAAQQAGFRNFNLDLMFALPNQTLEQAIADVERAISFQPPHLSHYQLTIEPNTPFYKNPPVVPDDYLSWEMQQQCQQHIAEAGYQHYEVSAYAQPRHQCQHNVNYWQFGDYIGLGAGAHGKITSPPEGKIWRTQMPASPGAYVEEILSGRQGRQTLVSDEDARFEFMLNALRLQDGFDVNLFNLRTGLSQSVIELSLQEMQVKGWATVDEKQWLSLTPLGKQYLNDVVSLFL